MLINSKKLEEAISKFIVFPPVDIVDKSMNLGLVTAIRVIKLFEKDKLRKKKGK
jgi:hypothetical protein